VALAGDFVKWSVLLVRLCLYQLQEGFNYWGRIVDIQELVNDIENVLVAWAL
jgi:hypothetical protein